MINGFFMKSSKEDLSEICASFINTLFQSSDIDNKVILLFSLPSSNTSSVYQNGNILYE